MAPFSTKHIKCLGDLEDDMLLALEGTVTGRYDTLYSQNTIPNHENS